MRRTGSGAVGAIVALLTGLPVTAADTVPTADLNAVLSDSDCATLACRDATTVDVLTPDGQKHSLAVPRSPYVTKAGTIVVFPGEAVLFDFPAAVGAVLGPPHFFSRIVNGAVLNPAPLPKPVIAVSFGWLHLGPGHVYTSIQITANFDHAILYDDTGTRLVDGKLVARRPESCVKLAAAPQSMIPPGVTGPILLGNFRAWPAEDQYNTTHDAKLIGCTFAAAPPG